MVERTADMSSLRTVLARLAGDDRAARVAAEDAAALIARIADAVDDTVLPRLYSVTGPAGPLATLTISNRRLIAIETGAKPETAQADEGRAAGFVRQLRRACKGPGPFDLSLSGRSADMAAAEESCSAADLREAATEAAPADALTRFFADMEPVADAWLFHAGNDSAPDFDGSTELLSALYALNEVIANRTAQKGASVRNAVSHPVCTLFAMPGDKRAVVAQDRDRWAIAVVGAADAADLQAAWAGYFRT